MLIVQFSQVFDPSDTPYKPGLYASRVVTFFFVQDIVVGHDFMSSWASDTTDFDMALVDGIKPGQSTRAQVIDLLGRPRGYYQYPLIAEQGLEALVYRYNEVAFPGGPVIHNRKHVIITVDQSGIVKDIKRSFGESVRDTDIE